MNANNNNNYYKQFEQFKKANFLILINKTSSDRFPINLSKLSTLRNGTDAK